jgi:hypothetical protein
MLSSGSVAVRAEKCVNERVLRSVGPVVTNILSVIHCETEEM